MAEDKENKNKKIGWMTSALVQLMMLLLFYFLIAWKEPYPPIPTYGIELNFGLEQSGRGAEPVAAQQQEPVEEEPSTTEEIVEEPTEEPSEQPMEEQPSEVTETPAETEVFEDAKSPDKVEPKAPTEQPQPKKEPTSTEEVKKEEPKKEPVKAPEPKVNEQALMPSSDNTEKNNNSQGTTESNGDEGKKEGTIDGRALYGSQGTSDGASLNMAGWTWDFKPEPNDKSAESGKIVYKIVIDSEGYLSRIDLVSSTVSPEVERIYRQSVERLSFSKTNDYKPAPTSTGYVTFIIKTR